MLPEAIPQTELAKLLGLTTRQVRSLTSRGVLARDADGNYPPTVAISAYAEHRIARAVGRRSPDDRVRTMKADQLAARMAREDRDLMTMSEALETVDAIAEGLLASLDTIGARVGPAADPVIAEVRTHLVERFAMARRQLEHGAT